MSDRFGAGLGVRHETKPPGRIEEEHRRGVVLACLDLEFGSGSPGRRSVSVKRDEAFVERARILGEDLGLVVLGIDGDEQDLDALAVRAQEPHRLAQRRHGQRADVRATRVAEIKRDDLAAVVRELVRCAVVPRQPT
jgi:hypothetical protein